MSDSSQALVEQALVHHSAGRLQEAKAIYERVLSTDPNYPPALHLLGVLRSQVGDKIGGVDLIIKAIQQNPNVPEFHTNLSLVYIELGRPEQAVLSAQKALELNPRSLDARNNFANALRLLGRLEHSVAEFDAILKVNPNFYDALHNMSLALMDLERFDDAARYADRAAALRGNDFKTRLHLGRIAQRTRRYDDAIAQFHRAIEAAPNVSEGYNNLGTVYQDTKRPEEALKWYKKALEVDENDAGAYNNLGLALATLGKHDEALPYYLRSIELRPDVPETQNNLGNCHRDLHQFDKARACYDRAIVFKADHADGHWNRSLLMLYTAEFANGWREYEWRWVRFPTERRGFAQIRWDGFDIENRAILLHYEQGLGDTIQFARYAKIVKERYKPAKVYLDCQPELLPLAKTIVGADEVVPRGGAIPPFEVYCPLMSVPLALGTDLSNIPAEIPYIFADPQLTEVWRKRLEEAVTKAGRADGREKKLKVGLVWSGSTTHARDMERSVPVTSFKPFFDVPGVEFHSLQKNPRPADAPHVPTLPMTDLTPTLRDFADTAAMIANLDLIICVDTSVTHLAAAMGKQTWALLPTNPDWRWMTDRTDSPWYPGVLRLFRQKSLGDWSTVIEEITAALRDEAAAHATKE